MTRRQIGTGVCYEYAVAQAWQAMVKQIQGTVLDAANLPGVSNR